MKAILKECITLVGGCVIPTGNTVNIIRIKSEYSGRGDIRGVLVFLEGETEGRSWSVEFPLQNFIKLATIIEE